MDGHAGDIYARLVDEYRRQVAGLRDRVDELDHRVVEAWFQCVAFAGDQKLADDLRQARHHRDAAEAALADAQAELERAEQRLARLARTLASLTTGPPPA